jgi:hypothetical protein
MLNPETVRDAEVTVEAIRPLSGSNPIKVGRRKRLPHKNPTPMRRPDGSCPPRG